MTSDDRAAVQALVSDLHWQIDQMVPRGIKNKAGHPYNPSYYKRGLQAAIKNGTVVEFIRGYLDRKPSDGFEKLEQANALDLACEALIADGEKPYAHLFTDDERRRAQERLEPFQKRIDERKDQSDRIAGLPSDLDELRALAEADPAPEDAIAINTAILRQEPEDVVTMRRLGRAHLDMRHDAEATEIFEQVLELAPKDPIATKRLVELRRRRLG